MIRETFVDVGTLCSIGIDILKSCWTRATFGASRFELHSAVDEWVTRRDVLFTRIRAYTLQIPFVDVA